MRLLRNFGFGVLGFILLIFIFYLSGPQPAEPVLTIDLPAIMSMFTGSTLGLYIASQHPKLIQALICYSPNINLYDNTSELLTGPWGRKITQWVFDSKYREFTGPEGTREYWTTKYMIEALISLKSLIENTMTKETLNKICQPTFVVYYYKNEEEQDHVVSVPEILRMFNELCTPDHLKTKISFPNVNNHVISSEIKSQDLASVRNESWKFAEEKLKLIPIYKN